MKEEIEFLKERAKEFWERGFEDLEKQRYNLSVLDFEQALQLWLKYLVALKAGDFPKTHFLTTLLEQVIKIYKSSKLKVLLKTHRLSVKEIENAYIASRYFPRRYTRGEAMAVSQLSMRIVRMLENETKNKLL